MGQESNFLLKTYPHYYALILIGLNNSQITLLSIIKYKHRYDILFVQTYYKDNGCRTGQKTQSLWAITR